MLQFFKYQHQYCALAINETVNCPTIPMPFEGIAYCFKHNIPHPNNFKPRGCQDPIRVANAVDMKKKCANLGLSFFKNKEKAIKMYKQHCDSSDGAFGISVGNLLAELHLYSNDGREDACEGCHNKKTTHFNFFPFLSTILYDRIQNTTLL